MNIERVENHIIRIAKIEDTDAILAFDLIAQTDDKRRVFIREAVEQGHCTVAEVDGKAAAYLIMERNFFGWPFIDLVYVHTDYRQQGLAALACPLTQLRRRPLQHAL